MQYRNGSQSNLSHVHVTCVLSIISAYSMCTHLQGEADSVHPRRDCSLPDHETVWCKLVLHSSLQSLLPRAYQISLSLSSHLQLVYKGLPLSIMLVALGISDITSIVFQLDYNLYQHPTPGGVVWGATPSHHDAVMAMSDITSSCRQVCLVVACDLCCHSMYLHEPRQHDYYIEKRLLSVEIMGGGCHTNLFPWRHYMVAAFNCIVT